MSTCEKCWEVARLKAACSQRGVMECYEEIIKEHDCHEDGWKLIAETNTTLRGLVDEHQKEIAELKRKLKLLQDVAEGVMEVCWDVVTEKEQKYLRGLVKAAHVGGALDVVHTNVLFKGDE